MSPALFGGECEEGVKPRALCMLSKWFALSYIHLKPGRFFQIYIILCEGCVHECKGVHTCAHAFEGEGKTLDVVLYCSIPHYLETDALTKLEAFFFRLGGLALSYLHHLSLSPKWSYRHMQPHPAFYLGAAYLNSGRPHVCISRILLPTEASSQPLFKGIFKKVLDWD